jgi:hypothetical protein
MSDPIYTVEFQTQVNHKDYPEMDSWWTKMATLDILKEAEEALAYYANLYIATVKGWHRKPQRIYRLTCGNQVLAEVNTITGETKAVLQQMR